MAIKFQIQLFPWQPPKLLKRSSNKVALNFYFWLEQSPFSAVIHLKKSVIINRSGTPLIPPPPLSVQLLQVQSDNYKQAKKIIKLESIMKSFKSNTVKSWNTIMELEGQCNQELIKWTWRKLIPWERGLSEFNYQISLSAGPVPVTVKLTYMGSFPSSMTSMWRISTYLKKKGWEQNIWEIFETKWYIYAL